MTATNDSQNISTDVVIIGGGLAGLTAAATAARTGARTVLVDARSVGGRARSAIRDGYLLNEGAHALYWDAGGRAVLERLGVRIDGIEPPTATYRTVWNGELAPLPVSPRSILTSRLLGTRSKLKVGSWFAGLDKLARTAPDISTGEWLDDQGAGADLQKLMLALLRLATYSARPERRPIAAMLSQLVAGRGGVRYLHGGWQSIVDELGRLAVASGVRIVEHEPVVGVQHSAGTWEVATGSRSMTATSIVFAAGGPALATGLLGADEAGWVERAGPTPRAACLDIGTTDHDGVSFLLSADEPLYLSTHAPVARLAPDGHRLATLMRYLEHDDPNDSEANRAELEAHAARAGLPAVGGRTIERFLAAPVVSWGSPQVGVSAPTGLELSDRGIYAAGDWIGGALLADASILSGERAGISAAERAMVAA